MKFQIRVKLGINLREPMRVNVLGSIKYMISTVTLSDSLEL